MHFSFMSRHRLLGALAALFMLSAPPLSHAGTFKVTGKVFLDATHIQRNNDLTHRDQSSADVDLKRFYIDMNYDFDKQWSVNVTPDINWVRGENDPDVWLKHAYLQRRFGSAGTLQVGAAKMPVMGIVLKYYGYRYIESGVTSREKIGSAADWGVHWKGAMTRRLDYAVSLVSGGGYKHPTHGKSADVEALLAYHPSTRTVLALGGYDGHLAKDGSSQTVYHTARRIDVLAAYAGRVWRAGVRYAYASNWHAILSPASERTRTVSAWSSYRFDPQWGVFARADWTQPDAQADGGRHEIYGDAGVEWLPTSHVRLAFAYKRTTLRDHVPERTLHRINEMGVWSQIVF